MIRVPLHPLAANVEGFSHSAKPPLHAWDAALFALRQYYTLVLLALGYEQDRLVLSNAARRLSPNDAEAHILTTSIGFRFPVLLSALVVAAFATTVSRADDATPTPAQPAPAQPAPTPAPSEPKFGPTPSPAGAKVYFIDLKDGAVVPPKFVIHFGLRNMGVAPAGSDRANSGHHHLLIDTDLPPLDKPIPNDFNHLHFGGGQTEAEVELSPGEHTLQLLLGDKKHVPFNPPVMSDRIRVTVVDPSAPVAAKPYQRRPSPQGARVYFVYPHNGSYVPPTFTVRFGLIGMGVAPAGLDKANTGHHHLVVDAPLPPLDAPIPNDFNHLHFGLGQTEAQVTLPIGHHTLQLVFADAKHIPHDPPVYSTPITIVVNATGKRPRPRSHRRHIVPHHG